MSLAFVIVHESVRAIVCRGVPVHGGGVWGPGEYFLRIEQPDGNRIVQNAVIENGKFVRLDEDFDT